ncbi:MAG: AI-2E family transporter [Dehalococcoidia bacterium]|nr:AI-2E family transporter [Dehalococcoidia bacterium]
MTSPPTEQPSLWMKWRLPGLVTVGVLIVAFILYSALGALLPIIISVIVAEVLFPIVSFIERQLPGRERYPRAARIFSIAVIYVAFLAIVVALIILTIPPIVQEARDFVETVPQIYEDVKATIEELSEEYNQQVPDEIKAQVEEWAQSLGGALGSAALSIGTRTLSTLAGTVSLLFGLAIVPFLLFYLLKDKEELLDGMYSILPQNVSRHTHNVLSLIHGVIGSYVRAQVISAAIVGGFVFLGLWALDIKFALTLGLLAGLLGLIPIIGAFIGAAPALLVALATDPSKLIWVVLLFIVVQFIESNIISPRIQGSAVRLHPIFIMGTLVVASSIGGLWGVLIGVPVVAASRDVFVYFYKEWSGGAESVEQSETEEENTDEETAEAQSSNS